jgi:hypothetical protein
MSDDLLEQAEYIARQEQLADTYTGNIILALIERIRLLQGDLKIESFTVDKDGSWKKTTK